MKSSWEWFQNYWPLEISPELLWISWQVRKDFSISSSWDTTSSSQYASRPGMVTGTSSLAHSSHPNPKPRLRRRTPKRSLGCQRYKWNLKNMPTHIWSPHCKEAPTVYAIPIQSPADTPSSAGMRTDTCFPLAKTWFTTVLTCTLQFQHGWSPGLQCDHSLLHA